MKAQGVGLPPIGFSSAPKTACVGECFAQLMARFTLDGAALDGAPPIAPESPAGAPEASGSTVKTDGNPTPSDDREPPLLPSFDAPTPTPTLSDHVSAAILGAVHLLNPPPATANPAPSNGRASSSPSMHPARADLSGDGARRAEPPAPALDAFAERVAPPVVAPGAPLDDTAPAPLRAPRSLDSSPSNPARSSSASSVQSHTIDKPTALSETVATIVGAETHFAPTYGSVAVQIHDAVRAFIAVDRLERPEAAMTPAPLAPQSLDLQKASGGVLRIVRIDLQPEDLGDVRVNVRISGARVQLDIEVARAQSVEAVRDAQSELRAILHKAGLHSDGISVIAASAQPGAGGLDGGRAHGDGAGAHEHGRDPAPYGYAGQGQSDDKRDDASRRHKGARRAPALLATRDDPRSGRYVL